MSRIDTLSLESDEVKAMQRIDKAMSEEKDPLDHGDVNLVPVPAAQYISGPYFTWDAQTIPPTRILDPERDGPYPVAQVHNSQSPGLKKQGRFVRPVTAANAELAIWIVEINGEEVTVHDPEEAWILEHRHTVPESGG